jgi:hypothetical protein
MATGAPRTYRIPLVLLAAANLAILGAILWPWQEALNLPVNGTTAIDPAISLIAYMGLLYWISSGLKEPTQKALSAGTMIGLYGGLVLVIRVLLGVWTGQQPGFLQPGLLGVAVILWGIAGLRGSRAAGNASIGALSGLWSAMVSGLMACAAILAELYLNRPHPGLARPLEAVPGPGHRQLRNAGACPLPQHRNSLFAARPAHRSSSRHNLRLLRPEPEKLACCLSFFPHQKSVILSEAYFSGAEGPAFRQFSRTISYKKTKSA